MCWSIDSVWTERWLATANVTDNYRGYQESDLARLVGNLKDKMYMSVHGSADHLVHYQHAMIIAKALLQENVLYSHLVNNLPSLFVP